MLEDAPMEFSDKMVYDGAVKNKGSTRKPKSLSNLTPFI